MNLSSLYLTLIIYAGGEGGKFSEDHKLPKKIFVITYSQVPIKRVGPNKQVGWIFYVNYLNK